MPAALSLARVLGWGQAGGLWSCDPGRAEGQGHPSGRCIRVEIILPVRDVLAHPSGNLPPPPGISFEVLSSLKRLRVGKLMGTRDLEAWRSQARGFSIQSCLGLHVPVPGSPGRALVPAIKGREQKTLMLTLGWVLGLISHKSSSAPVQLSDLG